MSDHTTRDPGSQTSTVFPRNFSRRTLPRAVSGDGSWLIDADGKRWLDASSGVFVAILGHSPTSVAQAIAEQVSALNFAYSADFTTAGQEALCEHLVAISPRGISHAILTTSGSAANETAIKLARQYHLLNGDSQKTQIISRRHSYHGSTVGALSLTGSVPRRHPFEPYLLDFPKVTPPNAYRRPANLSEEEFDLQCADEFEVAIKHAGAQHVSAVIVEPIAGAPLGAMVSSPDYLRRVREICDRHNVLLIIDEVVSGVGRSGDWFAIEESRIAPDIITVAKGLGGGFVPIGGVLISRGIHDRFAQHGQSFVHSESFTGHVLLGVAGLAVLRFIENHQLLARIKRLSTYLASQLHPLLDCPIVGDIRGRGLLMGIELVADKPSKQPFDRAMQIAERVAIAARSRGVLLLTGNAAANGIDGDTLMIAPPYVISEEEIDIIVEAVAQGLAEVCAQIQLDACHNARRP